MYKNFSSLAAVVLMSSLLASVSYAQLGEYDFDGGGDGTSWDDPANWNVTLNPDGSVSGGGDPGAAPDPLTAATIPLLGVIIDNTMPGQTARDVNVGTANGAGSLTVSGGDLTSGDDVELGEVGGGNAGSMMMSGGTVTTGDDVTINTNSSLSMTGGTLHVGDRLNMLDNATLTLDGGTITADDDLFFFGSSQITVNDGFIEEVDKLRFDDVLTTGKLTINGGLVRTQEYGFEDDFGTYIMQGETEINGDGALQVEIGGGGAPASQLTLSSAKAMIAEGIHLTTSASAPQHLGVSLVVVPDFFGRTDVTFVQISVVPEPSSLMLLGLGGIGLVMRRKRAC